MGSQMFSVYDKVSKSYMHPFCAKNDGVARRHFIEGVQENGPVCKSPDDYELHAIGLFNEADGALIAECPRAIISGREAWLITQGD